MAVLYCGGELEDVAITGTVIHGNTSVRYRTAYARTYLQVPGTGTFATSYARSSFTASNALGVTARVHAVTGLAGNSIFFWLATGGSARLRLKTNSVSPSTVTLESYNGTSATTLQTSTATILQDVLYRMDMQVSFAASGFVKVWFDGILIIDYTGNTAAGGGTTLDSANFGPMAGGASTGWSEIIITDGEDPRPLSLKTLNPNGAGDLSEWTGDYTTIDEITASDTDTASSAVAGQIMTTESTGMPAGGAGEAIRAVKIVASALRGAAGPQKIQIGVKSGSSYGWSSDLTLDTGYTSVAHTLTTDPATGSPFLREAITALKFALKSIA